MTDDITDLKNMVNNTENSTKKPHRKGVRPLADLIGATLDPICAKRGFGSASLLSWWPDIVGVDYEKSTFPESIHWPKRHDQRGADAALAVLTVRVLPSQALFFQHEVPQVLERINQFLGYQAIGRLRIVQGQIKLPDTARRLQAREMSDEQKEALNAQISDIGPEELQASLKKLGTAILTAKK
ncbi:MAG: DciA family protein [Hyphomicrobiales bacterium]